MLMAGTHSDLLLDETKICPDYVLGNDGGVGYYRVRIADERLLERSLREPSLSLRERMIAIGDVSAQVEEGTLPAATALRSLPALAADRDPIVAAYAPQLAWALTSHLFVVPEMEERWVKLIGKNFGERAHRLGFKAARGEDDDVQQLRDATVSLVAIEGRDKRLAREAAALAKKWLDNRKSVDPDSAKTALYIAARIGDREMYEVMRAETNRQQDLTERAMIIAAMVSFGDPVLLRRGLDFVLGDEVPPGEAAVALRDAAKNDPIGGAVVREWVRQNFDALMRKLPPQYKAIAMLPAGACDETSRRKHEQFFADKVDQMAGGKRILAVTLQSIDACIAARKVQEPSVIGFLRSQ
jgi:alanyl aminopeptidase